MHRPKEVAKAVLKTQGILLRRQEIRETSLIVIAFTRDLGKVHGLLKGVRGMQVAVPWYLEPLTLQAMVLYERKRTALSLISHCDLLDGFDGIRRDFARTAFALFCLDWVDAMTEVKDPHPEIFDLLLNTLKSLEGGAEPKSMVRFLEVQLLKASGLLPQPENLTLSPGARLSLKQILETPLAQMDRLRLSRAVEGEINTMTQNLQRRAVGRELKSRTFLHQLGLEGAVSAAPAPTREVVHAAA